MTSEWKTPDVVLIGFDDATPLLMKPEALRAKAEKDGFLYFRQRLPADLLLTLRSQILDILGAHGWLDAGQPRDLGVVNAAAAAESDRRDESMKYIGITAEAYMEIQRLELLHRIPHHPNLLAIYATLFQAPVLPHPRHIARVLVPSPRLAPTPPHQDYIHIQGTHSFWTCWFPLGDCPMDLGGLAMLRGSHREGVLDVAEAEGAGGRETILCGKDHYAWLRDDYACGDIITFPSHLVHKGTPNRLKDRVRLSLDVRYQSRNEPICFESLLPHTHAYGQEWDDIYRHWQANDLQYYWKSWNLQVEGKDDYWARHVKEKIC